MQSTESSGPRYARHLAFNVSQDKIAGFVEEVRERVIPKIREQRGNRRVYLLRSTGGGGGNNLVLISLWNGKEAVEEFESSEAFSSIEDSLRPHIESDAMRSEYNVEAHDINEEDLPPPKAAEKKVRRSLTSKGRKPNRSAKRGKKKSKNQQKKSAKRARR